MEVFLGGSKRLTAAANIDVKILMPTELYSKLYAFMLGVCRRRMGEV
jgi:hypothetical protein